MSDYKFKSFSEIDTVEAPSESTTVVGIESGKPIQMPMKSIKTGEPIIINYNERASYDQEFGDKVKEGLLNGTPVWVYYPTGGFYSEIVGFDLRPSTGDGHILNLIPFMEPVFSGTSMYGATINKSGYSIPISVSNEEI